MPSPPGALNPLELNSIKALPGLSNTRRTREPAFLDVNEDKPTQKAQ